MEYSPCVNVKVNDLSSILHAMPEKVPIHSRPHERLMREESTCADGGRKILEPRVVTI